MAFPALPAFPAFRALPAPSAVAELLKPITWFPAMWAFACGVVASGVAVTEQWPLVLLGVLLAGPLVCATSQAVNDWFDREVDAINEPVSYTHLRAHETVLDLVCRLLLEKKTEAMNACPNRTARTIQKNESDTACPKYLSAN